MSGLMKLVNKVTQIDSTVLITGESGTGKGLIARYIHENSTRSNEKLIEINCTAIPESLFEAELFGHESGAFTGAKKGGKPGLIEMANRGTLFLDEIGDLPMHMQVKLLKVLQDRKVTRVGAVEPIDIDVRIIAATNKDLKQLIEKEQFRADLYYRLNVFPIHVAPLRERKEDIFTLLHHYLLYYNKKHSRGVVLTQRAQEALSNYSWPGNVRELEHFIERLVIIKEGVVDISDLEMEQDSSTDQKAVVINKLIPLKKAINETESQLIHLAMRISQNSYEIADLLEISQASAYRKIRKYTN
jgi:transcriptional regulator with PAS, ATPase and Fis domain